MSAWQAGVPYCGIVPYLSGHWRLINMMCVIILFTS